ncbi:MAG TPA: hypothetical protein VNK52_09565 [Hyphomicrobiaceae bacterium]|nr:hypothetical protein [Hyphomicrobiaceae bacterium]
MHALMNMIGTKGQKTGKGQENGSDAPAPNLPGLDPNVENHLGRMIGITYAALLEPPPEKFVKLLEELERQERRN